ncbi:Uncharacterized protein APZ42_019944 [Daphnia magna]|uniref:Uncharacterized protein n=1 Tax=Daphnia magna TaxID=35525 RepID=A0A164XUK9_9CRUS|nr:Uncharacterized protein APZ42_019944 [Daphnia magna]
MNEKRTALFSRWAISTWEIPFFQTNPFPLVSFLSRFFQMHTASTHEHTVYYSCSLVFQENTLQLLLRCRTPERAIGACYF